MAALFALLFAGSTVGALLVILGSRFSPLDPPIVLSSRLSILYLTAAVPFFFAGAAVSLAVARLAGQMSRLYLYDLGGAAAGCLLLIPLLDHLGAPNTVLLVSVLAVAAAWVFASAGAVSASEARPRGRGPPHQRTPPGEHAHRARSTCARPRGSPRPGT